VDITKDIKGKCSGNLSQQFVNPRTISSSKIQIKTHRILQFQVWCSSKIALLSLFLNLF